MSNEMLNHVSEADASVRLGPVQQLIDGRWVDSASGDTLSVESPANRKVIAQLPRGGAEDVDRAVSAARKAFTAWKLI
ncbi:MAG: aldehyde dehydrogenase family protein, partial [Lautropia sp.]